MPIYQYKCKKCKKIEEIFQKINDKPLTKCPRCHGEVVKVISPIGIIFRGSGFHVTDYKKSSSSTHRVEPKEKSITEKKDSHKAGKGEIG